MSKRHPNQAKAVLRELVDRCTPKLHELIDAAKGERVPRDTLATDLAVFLGRDEITATYAKSIVASDIVDSFIARTSDDAALTLDQLRLFSEESLREHLRLTTFECGDGTVIHQSSMTDDDLAKAEEREIRNISRAATKHEKNSAFRIRVRAYTATGMSYEDAAVQVLRDQNRENSDDQ
ncbi:hypothetical protein [Paraburkholderia sp. 40]|uniref:hypothetical protein n=1 Tax=Paraburkholderia sp. 40 TaxID=2991059 RepID=UPI003D24A70D